MKTCCNFTRVSDLKKELDCFRKIFARLFYRFSLAGNIKFGRKRYIPIPLAFDNRRKLSELHVVYPFLYLSIIERQKNYLNVYTIYIEPCSQYSIE